MALAIDASTPAIAVQTSNGTATVTTASFTPPAGSLLLIRWSWNTSSGNTPATPSITDNRGTPLSYQLLDHQSRADTPTRDGQAASWYAPVTTSVAMTVTVTAGTNTGLHGGALHVTVLTGHDSVTPIGQHGKAGSASAASIAQSYTAQVTGSWGFIGVTDWDLLGAETAGTGCTLTNGGSGNAGSEISYGFIRRTTADGVAGNSTTLNVTIPGTSTNLSWVYAEVRPEPVAADSTGVQPVPFHLLIPIIAYLQAQQGRAAEEILQQTVSALGIISSEIFGSATVTPGDVTISASGIPCATAVGTPTITTTVTIIPTGITSNELLGTPNLSPVISGNGIITSEKFGNPTVSATYTISAVGTPSAETFGSSTINLNVTPGSIQGAEAFGNSALTVVTAINPTGIITSEAFGSPSITTTYTINANGIISAERVGAPTALLAQTVNVHGIVSTELFGTTRVDQTVNPSGITSNEFVGQTFTTLTVSPNGIISNERFGAPTVLLAQSINASGIVSTEIFGKPTVTPGAVTISASGIISLETFGASQVASVSTIIASGITSAVAFGSPSFSVVTAINASGIVSQTAFGGPSLQSTATIAAQGITSAQALGSPSFGSLIQALGISSVETFGRTSLTPGSVTVSAHGIATSEAFGITQITAIPLVPPDPNTTVFFTVGQTTMRLAVSSTTVPIDAGETTISVVG